MEDQKSAAPSDGLPEMANIQNAPGAGAGITEAVENGMMRAAKQKSVDNKTWNQTEQQLQNDAEAAVEDQAAAPALLSAEEGVPVGDAPLAAPVADLPEEYGQYTDNTFNSSVVISPFTGSVETSEKSASAYTFSSEDYRKKLQDIETQIKKMKDSGVEPNTDSFKNMADYEYRLWDKELNTIYQDILGRMSTEEADELRAEEREWMKLRDQTAHKAIAKYNGGTVESIEYTASMADSTKARAYELLEDYGRHLDYILVETESVAR